MLGEFPWIVRLGRRPFKFKKTIFFDCAGTLVNRYYVVTAGHCEEGNKIARIGENYDNVPVDCYESECAPEIQDIPVERYIEFGFNREAHRRDLRLALLEEPATLNEYVVPACLPGPRLIGANLLGQMVRIAGWGYADFRTKYLPDKLQYIKAPVLDPEICGDLYVNKLDESQLCVGYESGKDSCAGDSGGPLTKSLKINGKRQHYLLGVVSFGMTYCGDGPAVYTNVSYFMKEILDKIEKS
ncbi:unnamed protein product [Callosobruchus maculatus]|nr:unnamed protein product [Callosobruchus maculatus]